MSPDTLNNLINDIPDAIQEKGALAWRRCETLAMYTETPTRLTRTFLSEPMKPAHATVREWMDSAGLQVRLDGMGNMIGHRPPPTPDGPIYAIGSHLDSVPNAGIFDGVLGVTSAIAVAELLKNEELPFGLEIVAFSEEEGVRFGFPFLGSHAYSGSFQPSMLELTDDKGISVSRACSDYGLTPNSIIEKRSAPDNLAGYFELHIEQGFSLEQAGRPVGIVTTIAGQRRLRCKVIGEARHAGSTPMNMRRDALQAACEMIALTEEVAEKFGDLVMTTGFIESRPNASNCIPGEVCFSIDTRHHDNSILDRAVITWTEMSREIAEKRNVGFEIFSQQFQHPVSMSADLNDHLDITLNEAGLDPIPIVSWAGHDVLVMADACPVSMLMLRCRNGISHHPDEFVTVDDTIAGVYALYECIKNLKP